MNKISIQYKKSNIKRVIKGFQKPSKNLALFSHYDKDCLIKPYIVDFLKELSSYHFEIIFISTSDNLNLKEIQKIRKYTKLIIIKKNIGYDFGAWKAGLSFAKDYKKYQQILHVNDSIIFPLNHTKKLFENSLKYDLYGLTSSIHKKYHIQSFFLLFKQKITKTKFYYNFWNNFNPTLQKNEIISQYEIELAQILKKRNFRIGAFVEHYQIENLDFNNPYWFAWDILLNVFNAPFIKKNILDPLHHEYHFCTINTSNYLKGKYKTNLINYQEKLAEPSPFNQDIIESIHKKFYSIYKSKLKILIYGYGLFGKISHIFLEGHEITIADQHYDKDDYKVFNTQNPNTLDYNEYDLILVTAILGEDEVIKLLENKLDDHKKIVKITSLISFKEIDELQELFKILYINNLDLPQRKFKITINKEYKITQHFFEEYIQKNNFKRLNYKYLKSKKLFDIEILTNENN